MIILLTVLRAAVSAAIMVCVGLAFLPHAFASALTGAQKFLTSEIDRRRA